MAAASSALDARVLVLNRSYLPVHITSARRAFALVYQGIAKVVNQEYQTFDFESWAELSIRVNDDTIGLADRAIRVPRVILLQAYDRVPKRQVRFSRHNIYARDKDTCQYCGKRFPREELNLDHVKPRSQGGTSRWDNIVCSCHVCNRKKGGRTPEEAGMKLIRLPRRPEWTPFVLTTSSRGSYHEWLPFMSIVDASYWNTELKE